MNCGARPTSSRTSQGFVPSSAAPNQRARLLRERRNSASDSKAHLRCIEILQGKSIHLGNSAFQAWLATTERAASRAQIHVRDHQNVGRSRMLGSANAAEIVTEARGQGFDFLLKRQLNQIFTWCFHPPRYRSAPPLHDMSASGGPGDKDTIGLIVLLFAIVATFVI